jgi:hypothetical protein
MRRIGLAVVAVLEYIVTQVVPPLVALAALVTGIFMFAAFLKDPDFYGPLLRLGVLLIRILREFLKQA